MARVPCRPASLLFFLASFALNLNATVAQNAESFAPQFESIRTVNSSRDAAFTRVQFRVRGRNIRAGLQIRVATEAAPRGSLCEQRPPGGGELYRVSEVAATTDEYVLTVPRNVWGDFFLCLKSYGDEAHLPPSLFKGPRWLHQGGNVSIAVDRDGLTTIEAGISHRDRRVPVPDADALTFSVRGLRLEQTRYDTDTDDEGVPDVMADVEHVIRIFGIGFVDDMTITFTSEPGAFGVVCQYPEVKGFKVEQKHLTDDSAMVKIKLPPLRTDAHTFYLCARRSGSNSSQPFIHQGNAPWLQIRTYEDLLPMWAKICIISTCLLFSALFSGLNLGLMSLDRTELKILCNTGTAREKKFARVIQPVRDHGNYLLCSILLGNVFVNSIFTILLDSLTSGLIAVVFSTLAIVLIGEITPQAICSRHGLCIGARTIHITKVVMLITFPLAYPVSKFLDCVLGEEIGNVYNRERLKELVKVTTGENDLDRDEVNIISGALELRKKTVADVMTKIEDVFMLDYDAVLDFETVNEILKSGFSRIPVYEGNRQNIVTMLYIKDLAFVDPDDNTPLKTLCQFYQNPCNFVFEDVTLDVMFRIFKEGNKGHMAFVHRVNNEGEGDPFYETVGLMTLEDVIEELIQAEIMDETDVFTDNRSKRKRVYERKQDFSVFAERRNEANRIRISPQLTLAVYQFLSTAVEQFLPSIISETILKRLLKQDIIFVIKKSKEWRTEPANVIYQHGKAADYFVLILEGRCEVSIGKEKLTFEGGPFTYFGTQALIQTIGVAESPSIPTSTIGSLESLNLDAMLRHTFHPDYSVRAITEVIYLKIKRSLYLAAKRATLMERSQRDNTNEPFDEEVDKLMHSLEDDDGESDKRAPENRSSKSLTKVGSGMSSASPVKSPSLYCNVSSPHRINRDINGSVFTTQDDSKDEEVSLLSTSKNS